MATAVIDSAVVPVLVSVSTIAPTSVLVTVVVQTVVLVTVVITVSTGSKFERFTVPTAVMPNICNCTVRMEEFMTVAVGLGSPVSRPGRDGDGVT